MFHWTDTDVSNLIKFVVQSVRVSSGGHPGAIWEKLITAIAAELGATSWYAHSGCVNAEDPKRAVIWNVQPSQTESEWLGSEVDASYGQLILGLQRLVREYGCSCDEITTRCWDSPRLGRQNITAWIEVRPDGYCECVEFCKPEVDGQFTPRDEAILRVLATELLAQKRHSERDGEAPDYVEHPRLPRRQREVLSGLLAGSSVKEIAGDLGISPYTVNDYIKAIYRRYDVSSRGELLAAVHGLRPRPKSAAPVRPR